MLHSSLDALQQLALEVVLGPGRGRRRAPGLQVRRER